MATAENNRGRILFAIHSPWEETNGLSQVFMALMRQFQRMGYHCEKFSGEDAFPHGLGRLRGQFGIALYQRKLLRYIQQHGHRFDVIHTDHMLIPFRRSKYRFSAAWWSKPRVLSTSSRSTFVRRRTAARERCSAT